jgi:hypothetical protein
MDAHMTFPRLALLLLLAASLAGCSSSAAKQAKKMELDRKMANSRAVEQQRMNFVTRYSDDSVSTRGAELAIVDPEKQFNPNAARFGRASHLGSREAQANTFNFVDRVRTRDFHTRDYVSKSAWMGDAKFQTKDAPTRESWFSRLTARTKTYGTRTAAVADKTASTRPLVQGDRSFLNKGRRQAAYDTHGPAALNMPNESGGRQSWSGDLRPMTVQDVKNLLNKN